MKAHMIEKQKGSIFFATISLKIDTFIWDNDIFYPISHDKQSKKQLKLPPRFFTSDNRK